MFDVTPTSLPQINAGKVRPLGVTTMERLPFLPDVPTIDSFLKGYEAAGWIGFGVPNGTPPEIIAALNQQTNAAVLDPNIKQQFALSVPWRCRRSRRTSSPSSSPKISTNGPR